MFLIDAELGLPYDVGALPKVAFPVEPESVLGDVTARAAEEFGGGGNLTFLSEIQSDGTRHVATGPAAVLENDGGLRWVAYRQESITLEELRRTKDAGLFEGDPGVVALDRRPIGNGGITPWNELQQWVDSFGGIASSILAIRGLIAIVSEDARRILHVFRFVGRRVRARRDADWLREFLKVQQDPWIDAGATSPSPLLHFVLSRREWSADELSVLLRIEPHAARRFLEILGYDLSPWTGSHIIATDARRLRVRRDLVHSLMAGLDPLEVRNWTDEEDWAD